MINDSGILISFDPATGKVLKQDDCTAPSTNIFLRRLPRTTKFLIGQGGQVSVVKAAGEWEVMAVNELDDECFATPAISDGHIYIRTRSALYSFGK